MSEYALKLEEAELARYRLMAQAARTEEGADWAAAGFVPGATVADVGCGPAAVSAVLADVVGPGGHVHAVERDRDALAQARATVGSLPQVTVHEAEATDVPVDGLDAVMLRHVLAHNGGREQAIVDHLAARVRRGGWVYLVDADLTVTQVVGADPFLVEMNSRYPDFQRVRGNDPQAGLLLSRRLRAAGLVDVVHRGRWAVTDLPPGTRPPSYAARDAMRDEGIVTAEELTAWSDAWAASDALAERPTSFVSVFTAWGRRPV